LYAERHSWFMPDGFHPELGPWAATCFLAGLGYLFCRWTSAPPNVFLMLITAILFNVFCLSALVAGILFFRQKVNSAGGVWQSLAANSYGIYYVHPLILYPLAYVFVGISLPLIVKAPALIVLAIVLSWAVSALLLKKLPVLRAMF
jgi:glucans biosynthesis protein C